MCVDIVVIFVHLEFVENVLNVLYVLSVFCLTKSVAVVLCVG